MISANAGTPIKAIAAGRVEATDWLEGYGNLVMINHGRNDVSIYAYTQSILVKEGARVSAGQTIATVGNSGGQSRPALYFGITQNGKSVNPMKYLK